MACRPVLIVSAIFAATGSRAAEERAESVLNDASLAQLVAYHFGDARLAGGTDPLPRFLVADLNGDGRDDLVVAYVDEETKKRGAGCFGIGIVNGYLEPRDGQFPFHTYDCFSKYALKEMPHLPNPWTGEALARPSSMCVEITLRYGDIDLLCWLNGNYQTFTTGRR